RIRSDKCHINLRLRKVTDCDANVFIALYESILGEKVPDYIAAPCCQEDDVHNVQSVIDSLALDYLQISLSHITGENIVRGDKESIKNLLEIFDGLLEYLNEEISEESHNGGKHELIQVFSLLIQICASQLIYSFIYSSKYSLHSWNAEETESANELIELGDSARTFTAKKDGEAYTHTHTHTQTHPQTIFFDYNILIRALSAVKVKENDLLPILMEEFPHLHISRHTLGRMWEQQLQQVDRLHAISSHSHQKRNKLSSQVEEAQKKHDLLVEIVRKEQEHSRRLRDFKERIQQQKSAQNRLKEQRQQIARAKKYHNDYHVQLRARLMRERTKEEKMFRQLFEEGLELQKARLREQRAYAREKRLEHQRRHQDQIKSMENYYKDQFSLLAEALAQEREEIQVRKKAQEKTLLKMRRELRSRMEREIGELQRIIIQNDEDDYFRELDVQRLRRRVQMASFQYSTSCLP
uniref:Centrosomal protein 95 n=1 Tax=Myripristis murdjan TaxID=586833 RepID=A0A668APV6_9TELE